MGHFLEIAKEFLNSEEFLKENAIITDENNQITVVYHLKNKLFTFKEYNNILGLEYGILVRTKYQTKTKIYIEDYKLILTINEKIQNV